MAYSKAPTQDTYSSPRIPAFYSLDMRNNNDSWSISSRVDAGTTNFIPIKVDEDKVVAQLRMPFLGYEVTNTSQITRGLYVWVYDNSFVGITGTSTRYYVAIGNKVYQSGTAASWTAMITWTDTTTTSDVGFCEFVDSSGNKSLVIVNGYEGYVVSATTPTIATKITDPDFPSPHLPYPVFIDGYLFLAKNGSADIYNSNLDSPYVWTAGNFISSEVYPDHLVALAKVNNYLLAIGTSGCEYFYDAGNPSGSPLARYEGAILPFGCRDPRSIAVNKNMLVMLANMNDGEAGLVAIEEFKYKNFTPPWLFSVMMKYLPASIVKYRGYFLRQYGQLMYCFSLGTGGTFFYSFDTKQWGELAVGNAGACNITHTCGDLTRDPVTFFCSSGMCGKLGVFGVMANSDKVATIAQSAYLNDGTDRVLAGGQAAGEESIRGIIRTPVLDFGTNNSKTMSRLSIGMESSSQGTHTVPVTVTHYNNDWGSVYTTQTLQWTSENTFLTQQGMFRQRSIKFEFVPSDTSIRVKWFEFDINKGQQ